MHRVFAFFAELDYSMVLGQGALMLLRNYTYIFYSTHWAACIFYSLARWEHMSSHSWVGRNRAMFEGGRCPSRMYGLMTTVGIAGL